MRRFHSLILLASVSSSSATHQFNVTIHHTHPSIIYWPSTSWTTLTTNDASELQISGCLQQRQQPSTFYPAPVEAEREILEGPRSFQITTGVTEPNKELDKWSADCRGGGGRGGECDVSDIMPRGHLDSSHWPIKFRFKFIGPSVYVFGFAAPSPLIDWPSTTIGVTFTIDGEQLQTFAVDSRHYSLPCSMNGPIFSHVGLSNDHEHELLVTISPSWKFFLNSITFTHSGVDLALSHPSFSNPSSWISRKVLWPRTEEEGETTSTTDHSKKHNIATFAAAISSVVGVLAIISLIVIFSIIRRRRRARQRDLTEEQPSAGGNIIPRIRARRISSSTLNASSSTVFHTEASEDTPNPNFNLNPVVNHNNNGAQMTMMMVEGPTRMTTGLVPRFFHTGTTVLLYSAAASEGRGRGEVPLSSEREEDGGVLPPPYELSVGADSPSEINHLSIGREGDGGADEEGRDYTYADAPPPGTPPALPSRPPSPSPPLPSLSPSDSSPCSNPGNRALPPPPPLPSPMTTQVPTPPPPPAALLSPPIRRTPSPAPSSLDSRGSPPGLN